MFGFFKIQTLNQHRQLRIFDGQFPLLRAPAIRDAEAAGFQHFAVHHKAARLPSEQLDAMHAALFRGANIMKLKGRYLGHRMASLLQQMGVLKQIVLGCFEGTLSATQFHQLKRARRHSVRFQQEMLKRLVAKARHDLIVQYCEAVLNTRRGPKFRQHLNASRAILGRRRKS